MTGKSTREVLEELVRKTQQSLARISSLSKEMSSLTKASTKRVLGWAIYNDDQYTEASPLNIPVNTTAIVNINGATSIKTYLPDGVTDLYDVATSKITPDQIGAGYAFTISFKGSSTSNNGGGTVSIDLGGAIGKIFPRSFRFPRGTNLEHDFAFTTQGYALNTFVGNGGVITIKSDTGASNLYDFSVQIHKTSVV